MIAHRLFRWRLHYYRTWEKVAKLFRKVGEQLRRLLRPAEEPDPEPEPEPEPDEEPEPAPGEEEAATLRPPRYAPYDPELE